MQIRDYMDDTNINFSVKVTHVQGNDNDNDAEVSMTNASHLTEKDKLLV